MFENVHENYLQLLQAQTKLIKYEQPQTVEVSVSRSEVFLFTCLMERDENNTTRYCAVSRQTCLCLGEHVGTRRRSYVGFNIFM